ncbi:MAG: SH3 domain-containing protein [Thermomicrobiales bacterium]
MRRSRALVALLVAIITSTAIGLPAVADLNLILGSSAQVAYTNGEGVNVRDVPGFNSNVVSSLGEGVEVIVHDGPVAGNDGSYWYYVSSGGVEGWVIADFLSLPGTAAASESIWGEIAWTDGDGVNVRAQATLDSAVITTLHEGTAVTIVAGPEWDASGNAWTLVSYEGLQGWVLDDYVAWYGLAGGDDADRVLDGGWTAYVAFTDGAGLRLRGAATYDAETLIVMPEGSAVTVFGTQIYGADGSEWWNVQYEGILGYAMGYYFSTDVPSGEAATEPVAETDPGLDVWAGANAAVSNTNGEGVNLRYEWGYNSGIATWLAEGTIVWVIEGPVWGNDGSPWFQVDAAGTVGWIHGGFLTYTDQAPASEADVAIAKPEPITPAFSSDPVGDSIVAEGLRYVGIPYVWGGTTPAGFDCSGFVHYVLTQVFGYTFTRSLEVQAVSGEYVDAANLMPGDLVFFQNTYTWGLSHTGIYIGDGQFVHAGSERTGVTISSMSDDYWSSRYYTSRRVRS